MSYRGRVQNGVVVLEAGVSLPEGASVRVLCNNGPVIHTSPIRKEVDLPLVKTGRPASVALTNDQIAEILSQQDASS
jgi:hypothetical protein